MVQQSNSTLTSSLNPEDILDSVASLGFTITLDPSADGLKVKPISKGTKLPPDMLDTLKANKPSLLAYLRGLQIASERLEGVSDTDVLPSHENAVQANLRSSKTLDELLGDLAILYPGIARAARNGLSQKVPKVNPLHKKVFKDNALRGAYEENDSFDDAVGMAVLVDEYKGILSELKQRFPDCDTFRWECALRLCAVHKQTPDPYDYLRRQGIDPEELLAPREANDAATGGSEVEEGEGEGDG